jgi:hypothetical protein
MVGGVAGDRRMSGPPTHSNVSTACFQWYFTLATRAKSAPRRPEPFIARTMYYPKNRPQRLPQASETVLPPLLNRAAAALNALLPLPTLHLLGLQKSI